MSVISAGPFAVTKSTHKVMQLVGGFVQEAVSSDSAAVVQSMCNAVLDIVLLFTAPSPKARHQLEQVTLDSHNLLCSAIKICPYDLPLGSAFRICSTGCR